MKFIFSFLFSIFFFHSGLYAQTEDILEVKVNYSCNDLPAKEALKQIAEKTGIIFTYSSNLVSLPGSVTLNVVDKSLRTLLNQLLQGTNIEYKTIGKQVILQEKKTTPKKFTVSGYVREDGSSELLTGVNVYIPQLKTGTVTNTYGFYSLTVNAGDAISLEFSFVGYNTVTIKIDQPVDRELNVSLVPGATLDEVVISAENNSRQSESAKMSTISVPIAQIKNVPSLMGEKDVLKVLQLMPGVQKGMEGSSGLYVRGGGPDQNLVILDDATVYNINHLFGFFSIFNGDAIKSVELTKGGFPARYGGRLSSVLDINMKEGNKEEWHGEGGIGLISSRLTVEGPLKKNKSSVLISGRRTYADLISRPLTKTISKSTTVGYYFYDLNTKVNYDFGDKNKLYLSGYFGMDKFLLKDKVNDYENIIGLNWGNETGTCRWNHLFNQKLFLNTSVIFSNYIFKIDEKYKAISEGKDYYIEYNSGIRDYAVKFDFDYIPGSKHWIKTGASGIYHKFKPYVFIEDDNDIGSHIFNSKTIDGTEIAVYAEDTYHPFSFMKLNGGFRYSNFIAKKRTYSFLEPRLSAAFRLKPDMAFKASYATMNQYIHLLSNTGISLPTDLWVPSTDKIKPQNSWQLAAGITKDFSSPGFSVSLEGYYKEMKNIIGYKEGSSYLDINEVSSASGLQWEKNVTSGKGWSYGMELLLQKKTGRLNGWIGYTLSWSMQQFDSLNFGKKFYAKYDRRHDISIVGIYELTKKITLSAIWVYGTGNALSLPISQYNSYSHMPEKDDDNYYYPPTPGNLIFNREVENYKNKNDFRMAPYHRLDIGIQFHKQKKWGERTWEISVYNAYNRTNPFFYYKNKDENDNGILVRASLFPVIPSVTYSFKF